MAQSPRNFETLGKVSCYINFTCSWPHHLKTKRKPMLQYRSYYTFLGLRDFWLTLYSYYANNRSTKCLVYIPAKCGHFSDKTGHREELMWCCDKLHWNIANLGGECVFREKKCGYYEHNSTIWVLRLFYKISYNYIFLYTGVLHDCGLLCWVLRFMPYTIIIL